MPQLPTIPTPSGQRIAIVARRFWPISGPTELAVGKLATELTTAGHTVEIFTLRWQKGWPANLYYAEVLVRRVPKPTSGPWGTFRSTRQLSRHLVDFRPAGILAFGANEETWNLVRAFGGRVPVAVRVDANLLKNETSSRVTTLRKQEIYTGAAAIFSDGEATTGQVLHACPDAAAKIQTLPDLFDIADPTARTVARQSQSRNALADAHPVLNTEAGHPLVVCASPLNDDGGMFDLIQAWAHVAQQYPKARLWLLGDGPHGKAVWEAIKDLDLVYNVIMPGFFDDLSEVLLAADLYVHPLRHTGHDSNLTRAILAGVCPLGTAACEQAGTIEHDKTGLIVPPEQPLTMARAIVAALSNAELRQRLGVTGQQRTAPQFDAQSLAQQYAAPFQVAAGESLPAVN